MNLQISHRNSKNQFEKEVNQKSDKIFLPLMAAEYVLEGDHTKKWQVDRRGMRLREPTADARNEIVAPTENNQGVSLKKPLPGLKFWLQGFCSIWDFK